MKKILIFTIILMTLTACTTIQVQGTEPAPTEPAVVNLPNPASVHCEQNGNQLEIHTNADGSQSGICFFPDGSTCDEWAYFRGECGPAVQTEPAPVQTAVPTLNGIGGYIPPGTTDEFADWWGIIKSTQSGAQFDDYFERQDIPGQVINFGIDSMDPAVQAQIVALRDSGKIVRLYGTLFSNVPDYNGSQVQVDRIELEEQGVGGYMPPGTSESIADWWGIIKRTPFGAQYDDYFVRQDIPGQVIYFGIDSMDPAVKSQIEAVRDTGRIVHLYGTLFSNMPDYNSSQILVNRIDVEG